MDETDPLITFDAEGVCHYCRQMEPVLANLHVPEAEIERRLEAMAEPIRAYGKGREYDSLLGVSGGVDSSYVAYLAKKLGLRPMVVHFDNGWDSELAVENIRQLIERLGFDYYTYVINWEEFRDLQRSYFKASVLDIEVLTDQAIYGAMFSVARKHKIRYILLGGNLATENGLPAKWVYYKFDLKNLKAIQKRFGTLKLRSFPTFSYGRLLLQSLSRRHTFVRLLNHCNYQKRRAMQILESELGWRYYGGKHYESVFTKFYQAYYLPAKFNIDKRKAHLSSLIRNGELTRADALEELQKPPYDPEQLRHDKPYVLKKLGFSDAEFDAIMRSPPVPHAAYPSQERLLDFLFSLRSRLRGKENRFKSMS